MAPLHWLNLWWRPTAAVLVLAVGAASCGADEVPLSARPRVEWQIDDLARFALDDWDAFVELGRRAERNREARRQLDAVYDDAGVLASEGNPVGYDALVHGVETRYPAAVHHYGRFLLVGAPSVGFEPDPGAAYRYLYRAFSLGEAGAGTLLCREYVDGWKDGVPVLVDISGVDVCRGAADQGEVEALVQLAEVYRLGFGVEPDKVLASEYLWIAAQDGDAVAYHRLGILGEEGVSVGVIGTAEPVQMYIWAVENGDHSALPAALRLLEDSEPGNRNWTVALRLLEIVAERGDAAGAWGLARAFSCGYGVSRSPVERDYWVSRAESLETAVPTLETVYRFGCAPLMGPSAGTLTP